MGIIEDFFNYIKEPENAAALGLAGTGMGLALTGYEDLGKIGERAFSEFAGEDGLAQELRGMLEFQPYTVTSSTGGREGVQRAEYQAASDQNRS